MHVECFAGVVDSKSEETPVESEMKAEPSNDVVAMGEITSGVLKRVPLTLSVNLESAEAVALLDRGAK